MLLIQFGLIITLTFVILYTLIITIVITCYLLTLCYLFSLCQPKRAVDQPPNGQRPRPEGLTIEARRAQLAAGLSGRQQPAPSPSATVWGVL